MTLQYVNMVLHGVAAIHLPFAAVSMYLSPIPSDVLPIDTMFSGKFKYLTFWNAVSRVSMLTINISQIVTFQENITPFDLSNVEFNSFQLRVRVKVCSVHLF